MISSDFSNRLIFIFSLVGFLVAGFLLYEYHFANSVICPLGGGCDTVRTSSYSTFLGISIPILGVLYYLTMAGLSVIRTLNLYARLVAKIQLLFAIASVGFGIYLTYLEAFVIKAFCFWCVLSFIVSILILVSLLLSYKRNENRN